MEHLTVDEMIRFVSLTEMNPEAVELAASVNRHIRGCKDCLKRVRAFQLIYDEFTELCAQGEFRTYAQIQEQQLSMEAELHMGQDKRLL